MYHLNPIMGSMINRKIGLGMKPWIIIKSMGYIFYHIFINCNLRNQNKYDAYSRLMHVAEWDFKCTISIALFWVQIWVSISRKLDDLNAYKNNYMYLNSKMTVW